jgi:hypothetical protein
METHVGKELHARSYRLCDYVVLAFDVVVKPEYPHENFRVNTWKLVETILKSFGGPKKTGFPKLHRMPTPYSGANGSIKLSTKNVTDTDCIFEIYTDSKLRDIHANKFSLKFAIDKEKADEAEFMAYEIRNKIDNEIDKQYIRYVKDHPPHKTYF